MNIIIFSFFIIFSLLGIKRDTINQNNNTIFYDIYFLLFVLCGITRIGHTEEYSDLTHYVAYFNNDTSTYFEPGYIFLTRFIKTYIGTRPYILIAIIGLIIFVCINWASNIISKNEKKLWHLRFHYKFVIIAVYLTYWGLAFEAERLRIGIATSLFILALVAVLYGHKLFPILLIGLAITFQYTIIITVPVLILARMFENGKAITFFKKDIFLLWYVILVFFRIVLYIIGIPGPITLLIGNLQNIVDFIEMSHYDSYVSESLNGGAAISLKDIFYYICGYFMIRKICKYSKYNIIVFIYMIGLSLNVFFIGLSAGHRVSDIFISVNCLAVAFMGWMRLMPNKAYWIYLFIMILMQSVMSINYLGFSI